MSHYDLYHQRNYSDLAMDRPQEKGENEVKLLLHALEHHLCKTEMMIGLHIVAGGKGQRTRDQKCKKGFRCGPSSMSAKYLRGQA